MKKIRVIVRATLITVLALLLTLPGLFKSFVSKNWLPLALRMRRFWAGMALRILGVRIELNGEVPAKSSGPYIFVGNHRSYLDPIVVLRDVEALPIAKAEVSTWPVIGYCAKVTGIMWVKRESSNSRADTLRTMRKTLAEGYSVLVYPEGTTHTQPATTTFKRGAFRIAVELGLPVVPVGIEYPDPSAAWVGNDKFVPHFVRVFSKKHLNVKIAYGPPMRGTDARELLDKTKKWIDEWLRIKY